MNTHTDYIRLASWKTYAYTSVLGRVLRAWPEGWEQSKWLQYKGWRKEGFFIGHGRQQNKTHTIINCSGALSQKMLPTLRDIEGWYCTRIDLQITIEACVMGNLTLSQIRDECQTNNTTLIESMDNDTLYLGSRTSEKFTRLYEKFLNSTKYLRLEFELKGERSRAAWEAIAKGESLDKIFKYYVKKSWLPEYAREWFAAYGVSSTAETMRLEVLHGHKKKLEWLESLNPCIEQHMANHDIGDQVKILVRSWSKYADYLDGLNSVE